MRPPRRPPPADSLLPVFIVGGALFAVAWAVGDGPNTFSEVGLGAITAGVIVQAVYRRKQRRARPLTLEERAERLELLVGLRDHLERDPVSDRRRRS